MSYDLAVWEGERPANNRAAAQIHEALYEQYLDGDSFSPPTPLISKVVDLLLQRWPEPSEDEDTPWSAAPLIRGASGPYIYIPMAWSRADETSAFAAGVAARLGLVCFDPQMGQLRQ
ncbi:hypothetical protein [Actinoallomurus sp. CA-150999]|uniref:hypothetical protein n=1 Tax=Actinoallomurus sp. CA-150999 TaxID=3239887 RepID=UPI003D91F4B2